MSEQVKRYDAVHIRYEDNNIRYGEGCEVEVVTAADYEREVRIAIAAGQRMQDKCDALQAEAEALRVVLHEIASVNPAERGIEWAKSYASDGLKGAGSELYARWLETFKEAEALRAERDALSVELEVIKEQQPVAFYWQDIGYPEPSKHGPYFGWPSESALRNVDGVAIPVPLYTLPPTSHDQEGA